MGSVPKRLVDPTAIRAEDAQGDWVETSSRFAGQNRLNRINFRYVGPHLSEYLKLEIADVDQPQPAASGVLLYVEVCGICGSDVHGDDGSSGRRRPPYRHGSRGRRNDRGRWLRSPSVASRRSSHLRFLRLLRLMSVLSAAR